MKSQKGKTPSIQWYYKDWLSDRKLQQAHPCSRGIWMNLLMYMLDCSLDGENCREGILESIPIENICRLGGCNEAQAWRFIEDAIEYQFCNVELDKNVTFTIMSRRLSRDVEQRRRWRERQAKKRLKKNENPGVTGKSRQSTALSPTSSPTPKSKKEYRTLTGTPDCPQKKIIEQYHKILPQLSRVKVWDGQSEKNMRARWRQHEKFQNLEFWIDLFKHVSQSDFLMGRESEWQANLQWLVKPSNFSKVINGNYHRNKTNPLKEVGERWLKKNL